MTHFVLLCLCTITHLPIMLLPTEDRRTLANVLSVLSYAILHVITYQDLFYRDEFQVNVTQLEIYSYPFPNT